MFRRLSLVVLALVSLLMACRDQDKKQAGGPCTYEPAAVPCKLVFGPRTAPKSDGTVDVYAEFEGPPIQQTKNWNLTTEEADILVKQLEATRLAICHGSRIKTGACIPWMPDTVRPTGITGTDAGAK